MSMVFERVWQLKAEDWCLVVDVPKDVKSFVLNQSFPRSSRISAKDDFAEIFNGQKTNLTRRIATDYFVLLFASNAYTYPRLGVIINKKNVPKASARNALRRIIRESFRVNKQLLNCLDIVFIIYRKAEQLSNFELNAILIEQWEKLTKFQLK